MNWLAWLSIGMAIGFFCGVLISCLMVMARAMEVEDDLAPDVQQASASHASHSAATQTPIIPYKNAKCLLEFRSAMCGYGGPIQHCDKSFASCCAKNNEGRFWG